MVLSLNYAEGGRINSSFSGMGGNCGDATVRPYLTNRPNFTVGDFGGRKCKASEEMIVGIPTALIQEVADNLQKISAIAASQSS